ncbi:hypothetical protein [Mesorhizobium sp. WSM3859]|uniref:hypothetical protein n=1 Tax=Mesorhizobium sp. WSM3859 TaxID=2029402 RepID=UPI001140E1C2|nr:hypothetical protein [Mesorhizobium sp. WSM3859]
MSTSRRALLFMLGTSVVLHVAFMGVASAKGGGKGAGRDGATDAKATIAPSAKANPAQVRTYKTFQGKECRRDYARLCPSKPIGKCDLQGNIDQLSAPCKTYVQQHS